MSRALKLLGKRCGRWTVVARAPNDGRRAMWLCRCDCGNHGTIYADHLAHGNSTSCGCARKAPKRIASPPLVTTRRASCSGSRNSIKRLSRDEVLAEAFRDPYASLARFVKEALQS